MNITEYKKKDGTIVYRTSLYLGIDSITGKKIKTTISARTKKEIKTKALQAKFEFEKNGATRPLLFNIKTIVNYWIAGGKITHPRSNQTLKSLSNHR